MMAVLKMLAALCLALPIALLAAVAACAMVKRPERKCGCIIVLGAKVHPDGSLCRGLQYRCERAISAWKNGAAEQMILCGGQVGDEPCTEAAAMADFMAAQGVPKEALILEVKSRNTVENLKFAQAIMAERGFADAAIVTSDYHLQRALWIAQKFSIRACGIPAKSAHKPLSRVKALLRECVSWCVFWYYELKLRGR